MLENDLSSRYIYVSSDGRVCSASLVVTLEGTMPEQKQRLKSLHICKAFVLGMLITRHNCTTGLKLHRSQRHGDQDAPSGDESEFKERKRPTEGVTYGCIACSILWATGVNAIL